MQNSYGIICLKHFDDGIKIVMIKKATTYNFCEFVAGRYNKKDQKHLETLFNDMSYYEKMDILTLQFSILWYRIYKDYPENIFSDSKQNQRSTFYFKRKAKFENSFLCDRGEKLKSLINNSNNTETPWEFPKGRKNKDEKDIETAMREFEEETNIDSSKYNILWHMNPYVEIYKDFGVTYKNTFFFAEAIGDWNVFCNFNNKIQMSEISDIKWISLQNLHIMNLNLVEYKRLITRFRTVIKRYKNYIKKNGSQRIYNLEKLL